MQLPSEVRKSLRSLEAGGTGECGGSQVGPALGPFGKAGLAHLSHPAESFCRYCFPNSQIAVLLSSSLFTPGIIYVFYGSEKRWHLTREEILPPGPMILIQICMDYTNFSSSPGDYTKGKQKFRNSITWWRRQSKPLCGE